MALLFYDPWDFYTTMSQVWDTVNGTPVISSTSARFASTNGRGVRFGTGVFANKNFGANPGPTIFVAFAMRCGTLPTTGVRSFIQFFDTATVQVSAAFDTLGRIQFYRGTPSGGITIGSNSGSFTFGANVWHRVEIKVVFNGTTGVVELIIDGVSTVINSTGLNTISTANAFFNILRIGDIDSGIINVDMDDFIVMDSTGSSLNTFLGDRKLLTAMPNGAGALTQWTPNGAGTNFGCVDEIPPDDDTTYVSDATVSDRDLYTIQSLSFTGSADFLGVPYRARKDDASPHTIKSAVRSSSTDAFGAVNTLGSNYQYFGMNEAFVVDPNTSAAWGQTAVQNAQIGPFDVS